MCVFVFVCFGLVLKLLQPDRPLKELTAPLFRAMQPPGKPNITYTHSLIPSLCVYEYPACKPVCVYMCIYVTVAASCYRLIHCSEKNYLI